LPCALLASANAHADYNRAFTLSTDTPASGAPASQEPAAQPEAPVDPHRAQDTHWVSASLGFRTLLTRFNGQDSLQQGGVTTQSSFEVLADLVPVSALRFWGGVNYDHADYSQQTRGALATASYNRLALAIYADFELTSHVGLFARVAVGDAIVNLGWASTWQDTAHLLSMDAGIGARATLGRWGTKTPVEVQVTGEAGLTASSSHTWSLAVANGGDNGVANPGALPVTMGSISFNAPYLRFGALVAF
jgi:hypothetical protein